MKNTDPVLKWAVVTGIAVVSISVAYYTLWFLPRKENGEQARYHQARVEACLKDLEAKNTPVAQKLTQALIEANGTPGSEIIREGLENFTAQWNGQKVACNNIK